MHRQTARQALPVLVLTLALGGCGLTAETGPRLDAAKLAAEEESQARIFVDRLIAADARIAPIAWRVATANVALCEGETIQGAGLTLRTLRTLPRRLRDAAEAGSMLEDRPMVTAVVAGSPAEAAGFRAGDIVVTVGDRQIGDGRSADAEAIDAIDDLAAKGPVGVTVLRGGETVQLATGTQQQCEHRILAVAGPGPRAFTDGEEVDISTSIVDFAASDDELAFVIGHELAHAAEDHVRQRFGNALLGAAAGAAIGYAVGESTLAALFGADLGNAIGTKAGTRNLERQADYYGAYFAARAGYDPAAGEALFRRIGQDSPANEGVWPSHPATPERVVRLQGTLAEIATKAAQGLPLVPGPLPEA